MRFSEISGVVDFSELLRDACWQDGVELEMSGRVIELPAPEEPEEAAAE